MKTNIPAGVWIVMGILLVTTIYLFISNLNSVSFEEYNTCVNDYADTVLDYSYLGQDYLQLLICYQKGLRICEPLIEKYGNASVFTQK